MPEGAKRIGRYELLGGLSTGGMAEILLARLVGPGGFERPVVIKRILPHLARQRAFVDMFLDEARIAGSIRHPNVVHVHELGREGDELFLVMEYLEGESVAGVHRRLHLHGEELGPALGAHIVAEACAGLHAAHEALDPTGAKQNLVHRDVSPQNVMVTYDGHVKLLDFGVAKVDSGLSRTEAGQLKGKFGYMSPEQCRGEALDRRSDVFALGILLYEATTGRRLFSAASPVEAIRAICGGDVVPPSRLSDDYPEALERVCMRALSTSPEDRYPTAAEMRRDLLLALRASPRAEDPTEALARQMRSSFADRIAEKTEMLRRVKAGALVMHVPTGEVDEEVELPGTSVEARNGRAPPAPRRRRVPLALAGAVGAALLVATTAFAFLTRRPSGAAPVTQAALAAPPAPAAALTTSEVVIHVETHPPGATAVLDGQEQRGVTPLDVHVPHGSTAVDLVVRRAGYTSTAQRLVPDADQRILFELKPVLTGRARHSPPPAASVAPAPSNPWAKWN